jgi:hypothetical protein
MILVATGAGEWYFLLGSDYCFSFSYCGQLTNIQYTVTGNGTSLHALRRTKMKIIDTIGVFGGFLFLFKIAIHIFIKRKVDRKFDVGPSGHFLNPVLFLPIFDSVDGNLNKLKSVGNTMYFLSIILLVAFVVASNARAAEKPPRAFLPAAKTAHSQAI